MTSTDNFPHDDEHKAGTEDGDWVSSEPPVDDFDDSLAETATVSEGDEHPQEEAAAVVEEDRKKLPLLLLVGAIGALAVVGGVAYWQFGGHGHEQSALLDLAAQNNAPQTAVPDFSSKPLASAEVPSAAPASSANVAPTTSFSAPSISSDVANAVKEPSQQAGAATPAVASAPALSPPSTAVANAVVSAPASSPVSAQTNAAADARLAALSARIDDLQKTLGQATQQLGQISDKLTVTQTTEPAAVAIQSEQATEERLNKLEQKLLQVEQHQGTHATHVASAEAVFPKRSVKRSTHKAAHAKASQVKSQPVSSPKWFLRAATPNEAWVATGSETRDLRPVHVGDELSGVGKVTAIQQVGDGWVIKGSAGVIR
jgi:hypothetical protein